MCIHIHKYTDDSQNFNSLNEGAVYVMIIFKIKDYDTK